jgi:GNAT superfamily N-acetyltransferase
MSYIIMKVDGVERAADIQAFNKLFPKDFLPLKDRHLENGYWWLVYPHDSNKIVGFAGMVPFVPFTRYGYLKRAAILPEHRGNGIQKRLLVEREVVARDATDWTTLVSSTHISNTASANSFIGAGYKLFEPERPWEGKDSIYWMKVLS